jgi:hypothetical protein
LPPAATAGCQATPPTSPSPTLASLTILVNRPSSLSPGFMSFEAWFWVTFGQRCDGATARLRGDVRVTTLPPPNDGVSHSCVN